MAISNKERITSYNERLDKLSDDLDLLPKYEEPEDLDPELDTQEDIIAQIKKAVAFKGAGVQGVDFGEVTTTSSTTSITIPHKLGVAPVEVILVPINCSYGYYKLLTFYASSSQFGLSAINEKLHGVFSYSSSNATTALCTWFDSSNISSHVTFSDTEVKITVSGSTTFASGTYMWIVVAPNSGGSNS